ncbi:MAG: DUF4345 domain-containing protein [Bacteroidota bacterium]
MKKFHPTILVFSGLALFYACSMRLIYPAEAVFLQGYFAHPGNSLELHLDLVNEIRGVGAVMLLGGIATLLGAFRAAFRSTAFVVAVVIFGGVILGRFFSFWVDGFPHGDLLRATVAEGVLAGLNLIGLGQVLTKSGQR